MSGKHAKKPSHDAGHEDTREPADRADAMTPQTSPPAQLATDALTDQLPDAAAALVAELDALRAELTAGKDRELRAVAELENYRRRAFRQMDEERRYANLPLMRDLLPVLDNLNRAIEAAEKTPEGGGLLDGVKMVVAQFRAVLENHHCLPIAAHLTPFNPNFHEAILQQPSAEHPPNTVLLETQTGFRLHDRVVRPSQVIVSSQAAGSEPSQES
jgi:molecular chaperone GrpE